MAIENLHIKKVFVESYKSLKNSEVEFESGLNIVIGRNGAGKSNLLNFLFDYYYFIPQILTQNITTSFSFLFQYFAKNKKNLFRFAVEKRRSETNRKVPFEYELTFNRKSGIKTVLDDKKFVFSNRVGNKEISEIVEVSPDIFEIFGSVVCSYVSFEIPKEAFWLSMPGRSVIERDDFNSNPIEQLSSFSFIRQIQYQFRDFIYGELLDGKLSDVNSIKGKLYDVLNSTLENLLINEQLSAYSIIQNIRFNPNINVYITGEKVIIENIIIDFYINNEWFPWSYLSDGTKRIFYLISECLWVKTGLVLIEEPELGIHPHQLYKLLDFLKEQSKQKQVIISTHSPLALDVLNEKELNRIIIAEYDNNGTKFRHLTKAETAKAKSYIKEVGELSYYWLHSDLEK